MFSRNSNLGYRYQWQDVTALMRCMPDDVIDQHRALLEDIKTLDNLEVVFGNTLYHPIVAGTLTEVAGMRSYFTDEVQRFTGR